MQGRLTSQQVLETARNSLDALTIPPLLASAMNEARDDLARLARVMSGEEKIDEKNGIDLAERLRKNVLSYLDFSYQVELLYDEEKFDEKSARPDKLYLKQQPDGLFEYTVKAPDGSFVSRQFPATNIPEYKEENNTKIKLTKHKANEQLIKYKKAILDLAYEQHHLVVKPVYPSPDYNALHNVLLLLGIYFPNDKSLGDNKLQCALDSYELTKDYFVTEEGIYFSQKTIEDWFYKNKCKNPWTNRMWTARDEDRAYLFYLQQHPSKYMPYWMQKFRISFSIYNAGVGAVVALGAANIIAIADAIFLKSTILNAIAFYLMPAAMTTSALSVSFAIFMGFIGYAVILAASVVLIGALIGGLRIHYSLDNTISGLQNKIGELPDFRDKKGYMHAGNKYTLFGDSEPKTEPVSSPKPNQSLPSPVSPRLSH